MHGFSEERLTWRDDPEQKKNVQAASLPVSPALMYVGSGGCGFFPSSLGHYRFIKRRGGPELLTVIQREPFLQVSGWCEYSQRQRRRKRKATQTIRKVLLLLVSS